VEDDKSKSSAFDRFPAFFCLYWLQFECVQSEVFKALRKGVWQLKDEEYTGSFGGDGQDSKPKLQAMGMDMS
jgi:hypothetical protein